MIYFYMIILFSCCLNSLVHKQFIFHIRNSPKILADYSSGEEIAQPEFESFHDEILHVIESFIYINRKTSKFEVKVDPSVLIEKSHIISKGRYYEEVIEFLINECSSGEIPVDSSVIEQIDSTMRGYITSERKNRARLKLKYLLTAASSDRLDLALANLRNRLIF